VFFNKLLAGCTTLVSCDEGGFNDDARRSFKGARIELIAAKSTALDHTATRHAHGYEASEVEWRNDR